MKYIESEVLISAMILAMMENNITEISEDKAFKFGVNYTVGLKNHYFPNEPLVSGHISHESIVEFCDNYPDCLAFNFQEEKIVIKYMIELVELTFKANLIETVNAWCDKVNIKEWWKGSYAPFFHALVQKGKEKLKMLWYWIINEIAIFQKWTRWKQ